MIRHGVVTVTAAAQSLATALGLGNSENANVKYLSVQPFAANTGRLFFGGPAVSATVFGFAMEIPVSSIPSAPYIVTDAQESAGIKVGDLHVIGTANDKIAVMWVPYQ